MRAVMLAAAPPKADELALSHFDEYRRAAVVRDQIDFAEAAAVVAGDDPQSALFEVTCRERLSGDSASVHMRLSGMPGPPYSRCPGKRGIANEWKTRRGMKTPSVNGRRHYM